MGKASIPSLKSGATPEKTFTFDVRCRGMRPEKPVPVKIYFEGDSTASGMLNLSGAGQASVAQVVAIDLKNDKSSKLPFNKSDAINLNWQRSEADICRFSGSTRYAASGSEIKPGKADAALLHALEYN